MKVVATKLALKAVERRHLRPARDTPGRPDVQKYYMTTKVGEFQLPLSVIDEWRR